MAGTGEDRVRCASWGQGAEERTDPAGPCGATALDGQERWEGAQASKSQGCGRAFERPSNEVHRER